MSGEFNEGKQEYIPLDKLLPHPNAQRKFDPSWAQKIFNEFDPVGFGIPTVARMPRGKLWLIDGQHRCWAALQYLDGDGTQQVKCRVIDVEDDAECCELFDIINNHKTVRPMDKFLARVGAGNEEATAITAILERYSLKIGDQSREGVVRCVEALQSVYKRTGGDKLLDRTMRILVKAWGKDADAGAAPLVRGVALLIVKHGDEINDDDLAKTIAKHGNPAMFLGKARSLRSISGMSLQHAMADCLKNVYNTRRKTGRIGETVGA